MGRIAVIGGGIGGLTAAYLLSRRHHVTLFEKEQRLGGNAYTLDTREGHAVDIAVAAFGRAGYPHFYRLLDELGIETAVSPGAFTSMHDLDTGEGMYVTPSLTGLLAQRFDLLRPRHLRELLRLRAGLVRLQALVADGDPDLTLDEALSWIPELEGAPGRMLLFALCLLSSMSCDEVLAAPAAFFAEKLAIHSDVVSPRAFYSVRCVPGGTRRYVQALAGHLPDGVVLRAPVRAVVRDDHGVIVVSGGEHRRFDDVVIACNADQALGLLDAPTEREEALLGAWRYKDGTVVVHTDHAAFPARPLIQAYTFLYTRRDGRLQTSVNGCLWREPGVARDCRHIASQHPNFPIREDQVELRTVLRTPIFDFPACRTTPELPSLNGTRHTYYCGSYFGHGLHEDAVASAVAAARALGVSSTI